MTDDREARVTPFLLSAEQRDLRDTVRRWSATHREDPVAQAPDGDAVREHWQELADDLGVAGVGVAEDLGGLGMGMVEAGLVAGELGATLSPAPYAASLLATTVLARSAPHAALLASCVSGRALVTFVDARPDSGLEVRHHQTAGGWSVTGVVPAVTDAPAATHAVIALGRPEARQILVVDLGADGVRVEPVESLDQTRTRGDLRFSSAPASAVAPEGREAALDLALDRAALANAAGLLGSARAALDLAVEYARTRWQFGRPIGSFQAVKHRCAEMLVDLELAESLVTHAAEVCDARTDPLAIVVAVAAAHDAARRVAKDCIQVHGGIAFTWEHPAHRYLKRIYSDAATWSVEHRAREILGRELDRVPLPADQYVGMTEARYQ